MLFTSRRTWLPRALALTVALAAFGLRVYHLGGQSLWYDEGISLYYASADPPALVGLLARLGEFPPLYFLLLHYWMSLAGQSELALRFPSVVAGVLGVVLICHLGRLLAGSGVGLTAGLLLAASPLHVWQSQETRMYTLAVALGLVVTYLFVRLLEGSRGALLAGYALAGAAGLYTHFTFGLVLVAHVICLGLWVAGAGPNPPSPPSPRGKGGIAAVPPPRAAKDDRGLGPLPSAERLRIGLRIALAGAGAGLLFVPWLPLALQTYETNATYWPGRLDVLAAGRDTMAAFVAGELAQPLDRTTLAVGGCLLAGLGLLAAARRRPDGERGRSAPAALLLGCYLLVPAAAEALLLLDRPKYAPRYLLVALPAFCLLAAWATSALPVLAWRRLRGMTLASNLTGALGLALGLGCLAAGAWSVQAQTTDIRYAREDYKGLAAYLASSATADDSIILLGGHVQVPFLHYYEGHRPSDRAGAAPVYPLPDSLLPAVARPIQHDDLAALNSIVPGRRRVWVVRWQDHLADPAGMVLQQLELAGRRVDPGRVFHGLQLDAFEVPGRPTFPVAFQPRTAVGASFENGLTLVGFDLAPERARPGDTLRLSLYWRATAPADADYVAFAQLLNRADHIYGQHDKPPVSETYRTSRWAPGDLLKDEYQVRVRPGTPPGQYRLQVGLYDRASLRRVGVRAAPGAPVEDRLVLAEVRIDPGEPLGAGADAPSHRVSLDVAPGMRLLGYDLEPEALRPGEPARIALLWLATAAIPTDRQVRVSLLARDGREVAGAAGPPADGTYPTSRWRLDDLVRDVHSLTPPADLPRGEYTLAISTRADGSPTGGLLPLGAVEVR